jgi:hypothetical protein
MHLTTFSMTLDKEQAHINRLGVVISNKDKLQFYMKQIYASNCFDKKEMVDWENKPIHIKDDYNEAKLYFEGLVRDFKTSHKTVVATPEKWAMRVPTKWQMSAMRSISTSRRLPAQQLPPTRRRGMGSQHQQRSKG